MGKCISSTKNKTRPYIHEKHSATQNIVVSDLYDEEMRMCMNKVNFYLLSKYRGIIQVSEEFIIFEAIGQGNI